MSENRRLTHVDDEGRPSMVDVTSKPASRRTAMAEGHVVMSAECLEAIVSGATPKGDVLQVARIAAITGGKRTADLIPLCHGLPEVSFVVDVEPDASLPGVRITAEARVSGSTGVEMEALTAVSVGLLTVYDMAKSMDRGMKLGGIRLLSKAGGRSGAWTAEGGRDDDPLSDL